MKQETVLAQQGSVKRLSSSAEAEAEAEAEARTQNGFNKGKRETKGERLERDTDPPLHASPLR